MLKDYEKIYSFIDTLPIGCVIFKILTDDDGNPIDMAYEYVNESICEWVGKPKSDFYSHTYFDKVGAVEEEWLKICSLTAFKGTKQNFIRYGVANKRWLNVYASCPEYGYCFLSCIDISAEKKAKEQLSMRESDDFILQCARILHCSTNLDESISIVLKKIGERLGGDRVYIFENKNSIFKNTYEWCTDKVQSSMCILSDMPHSVAKLWEKRIETSEYIFLQDTFQLKDGILEEMQIFKMQGITHLLAVPLLAGNKLIGYFGIDNYDTDKEYDVLKIFRAMSYFIASSLQNEALMSRLTLSSYHDSLTGALNRAACQKLIRENYDSFFNVGVAYCDVNGLKTINDEYGHNEGDFLICEICNVLSETFHKDNVYRIGGDEFVVILNNISKKDFQRKLKDLNRRALLSPNLNFALGTQYVEGRANIDNAMRIADEKMYENKKEYYTKTCIKSGRYRPHIDDKFGMGETTFFAELLSRRQFLVYYQPKIGGEDNKTVGAEALVRYLRTNGEIVAASEFIEILEASSLISELDYYVIGEVCANLSEWINRGITPVPVSINLTKRTICDIDFLEKISNIFKCYSLPHGLIEFEINENIVNGNAEIIRENIAVMKGQGYSFAIDKFGGDQSNIVNLLNIDIDTLKMDASLVQTVVDDKNAATIVKGLVYICRDIHVSVIAVGVETEAQFAILKELGVDEFQGWYFAKPMPVEVFERDWLKAN